jgi:hypothetical protein
MREESGSRRNSCTTALLLFAFFGTSPASAQDFTTSLVAIHQGSALSDQASSLRAGGYELQDGTWVSFDKWYRTSWIDLHVDLLTQITEDNGILWGFGTGERGDKYRIAPSFKLGFMTQMHPNPASTLSLSLTTTFGGDLTERTCNANYGDLGTYTVNCRLAASETPPEETLKYLVNAKPERLHLWLSYRVTF